MTAVEEFKAAVKAATTAEELRAASNDFVPVFVKLSVYDKNVCRLAWKQRRDELGVKV